MPHRPRTWIALCCLLLAGCGDSTEGAGGDGDEVPTDGGSIFLDHCGYEVTTRPGASAPAPGAPVHGADPTPRHVHLGVAGDASTSVAVQWRTPDETTLATTVQYGAGDALDRAQEGFTFHYVSGINQNGELVRIHEAHLCGLEPDTEYSYRVGGAGADGAEVWSETFRFRTAPAPSQADAEIVVAVLGDSRGGQDVLGQLAELAAGHGPDLVLFTGDAVTVGALQLEWEAFFDAIQPLAAAAPLVAAHGNHEVNAINHYAQLALPGDEENFSLDYGPVHVTVLNDTPVSPADIEGRARDLLASDLAASQAAPWKLLVHHRSMFSASRHGSDRTLQQAWGPLVDEHAVDLVLSGHDHVYERSKPLRGGQVQASPAEGTVYLVSGGAGASLYDAGAGPWTEVSEKTYSVVILRIRRGMLELQALREDGSVIDTMTITK